MFNKFNILILICFNTTISCQMQETTVSTELLEQPIVKREQKKKRQITKTTKLNTIKKIKRKPFISKVQKKKYLTEISNCQLILKRTIKPLKKLRKSFPRTSSRPNTIIWNVSKFGKKRCKNYRQSHKTLSLVAKAFNEHSGKIGVILPLSGPKKELSDSILSGLKASAKNLKIKFNDLFIVKDSFNSIEGTTQALSDLLFNHTISIILGGLENESAEYLTRQSKKFFIPTILINGSSEIKNHKYKFHVFPKQIHLAKTMIQAIKQKNIKKIAIFEPSNSKSKHLIDSLKKISSSSDIIIHQQIPYTPGNFQSMEAAVKALAGIDYIKRKDEYDEAFQLAKKDSEDKGVAFNSRLIVLPPKVEVDALIIPDDFRILRHFAKLLRYHGITNLPLIGNHEWRSKALLEPWDPYLQGNLFVDFIGSYKDLPKELEIETGQSPYFIDPEQVTLVDFKLIGFRAGLIALRSLKEPSVRRRDVAKEIVALKSQNGFYTSDKIFDKKHFSSWPTYLFTIHDHKIVLLNSNDKQIDLSSKQKNSNNFH